MTYAARQLTAQTRQIVALACQQCKVPDMPIAWDPLKAWYTTEDGEEVHEFIIRIREERAAMLLYLKYRYLPPTANLHYAR